MVQRYETYGSDWELEVFESDDGNLVSYADYAKLEAELQKYKDQFPDYVECANCGSVTHAEGVEDATRQSGCRKEDSQECYHNWRFVNGKAPAVCINCGVTKSSECEHEWQFYGVGFPCMCLKCGLKKWPTEKEIK